MTAEIDPASQQPTGVIQAANSLRDSGLVHGETREALDRHPDWFKANLPEPDRFVLTRSKGSYRRQPVGISWFKAEANECVSHAEELGRILEAHGIPVQRLRTAHPGYVACEDGFQIVTVPFRDR